MYDQSFAAQAAAAKAVNAQGTLSRKVNVNTNVGQVVAGVNNMGLNAPYLPNLIPITIQHTAGTANEIIRIGDPSNLVKAANSIGALTEYSSSASTWTSSELAEVAREGFLIRGFNYSVSNTNQFAAEFLYASANAGKSRSATPLQGAVTASQRSTDQNLLIRTLDLSAYGGSLLIDRYNALFLTVLATYTVTLTITMEAVVE